MEEIEIWRAANQLLKQYQESPDSIAAQRAKVAFEQGDMFNFNLWTRITKAVQALQNTSPFDGARN